MQKLAKVSAPRISGICDRDRLDKRLLNAMKTPVVWITAPPGAGKTTLVASYLQQHAGRYLWLQADAGDNDAATFFHYLGLAAKQAAPRSKKTLTEFTPEYTQGLLVFSRNYFRDLFAKLRTPSVLVIDNYHDVSTDAILHKMLAAGFEEIPPGCNILVISRSPPPSEYSKLQLNRTLVVLSNTDLQFSFEEAQLLAKSLSKNCDVHLLKKLYDKVAGWAAGLVLLLEQHEPSQEWDIKGAHTPDTLFQYFMHEVFNNLDHGTQEFLKITSLLPNIPEQVAEKISGDPMASQILIDLDRKHFFTQLLDQDRKIYRYHPLFREFLQSRFREDFCQARQVKLFDLSAEEMLENGYREEAIDLYLQAENWSQAIYLLQCNAESMIEQGRYQTLFQKLAQIPDQLNDAFPELNYWRGMTMLNINPPKAQEYLESAWRRYRQLNDEGHTLLCWCGIVDAIVFTRDRFDTLDEWYSWFSNSYTIEDAFPSPLIKAKVATSLIGIFLYRYPNAENYRQWITIALETSRQIQNSRLIFQSQTFAMIYFFFRGELDQVSAINRSLEHIVSKVQVAPLVYLAWKWMHGAYLWLVTRNERESMEVLLDGLEYARKTGVHYWDHQLYAQLMYFGSSWDHPHDLSSSLENMKQSTDLNRCHMAAHYYLHEARYALCQGDPHRALAASKTAVEVAERSGAPFTTIFTKGIAALALMVNDDIEAAKNEIVELLSFLDSTQSYLAEYSCYATLAWISLRQGDEEAFTDAVNKFVTMGQIRGFTTPWFTGSVGMADVCIAALERNMATSYIVHMIRTEKLVTTDAPLHLSSWPWQIKIKCLGHFQIALEGRSLPQDTKSAPALTEFLKCLIAFGGRHVSREKIAEVIWPDADGDTAKRSFDTTLHRLRKQLNNDAALVLKDSLLSLDTRFVWVDCWAVESIVGELERNLHKETVSYDTMRARTEQLFDGYTGDFLAHEADRPWSLLYKQRIRQRVLKTLQELAAYWLSVSDDLYAQRCLERGIVIDPVHEPFYQLLMKIYLQQGNKAQVVALYERCRMVFSSVLGVMPSEKTISLYRQCQ